MRGFAREGINVIINGIAQASTIDKLLIDLNSDGVSASYHNADMKHPEQIRYLINNSYHKYKSVDILVNNAGI